MNPFENWCNSQNLPATADRRAAWDAALEEAVRKCDALAHIASVAVQSPWHGRTALQEQEQFMTAASLAVEIRSMQTTAGAAATPTKSIGERIADEIWGELDGTWMGSHPVTADKKRKFAAAIDRIIAAKTAGAAGGEVRS